MYLTPAFRSKLTQTLVTVALTCGVAYSQTSGVSTGTSSTPVVLSQPTPTAPTPAPTAPAPADAKKPAVQITPLTQKQQEELARLQKKYADLKASKNTDPAELSMLRGQFEKLVAANYNNPEPHFGLALVLTQQEDYKGAIFELDQFSMLAPDRYEGSYNLGVIASIQNRHEEALALYTDAAKLSLGKASPEMRVQILRALAAEQNRKSDWAGLVATLGELVTLAPNDDKSKFMLAQALFFSGDGKQALTLLYGVMQRQPQNSEVVNLVADIYVSQSLADRALRELDSAVSRQKDEKPKSVLLLKKANIITAAGASTSKEDTLKALYSVRAAEKADATNASAFMREAELLMMLKDRKSAMAAYSVALEKAPENLKAKADYAAILLSAGQMDLAKKQADDIIKTSTDKLLTARAQYIGGVASYRLGNYSDALPLLRSSASANAKNADALLWLGLTQYVLKDYPAAAKSLSSSVEISPSVVARQNLASALLASGKYPDAEVILRGLVKEAPNPADIWYFLGLSQKAQNRPEDAKISFKKAADLGSVPAKGELK